MLDNNKTERGNQKTNRNNTEHKDNQELDTNLKPASPPDFMKESQQNTDNLQAMDALKTANKQPSVKKQNHNYVIDY